MSRSPSGRWARALAVISLAAALSLAGAVGDTKPASAAPGDTTAVAINTKDGASVFRLAFSIRRVTGAVVDQTNAAIAYASCTQCQTVALAFQVILATGDPSVVTPTNIALAYNESCSSCVTFAAATQIFVDTNGTNVRFTKAGRQRLHELRKRLRGLADQNLSVAELEAELQAARAELASILSTELVPVGSPRDDAEDEGDDGDGGAGGGEAGSSTTTSSPASRGAGSTSTSAPGGSAGSSTSTTSSITSTTSTTARSTTTTAVR